MKSELPLPESVAKCHKAMELARIWIANGNQHVILSPNLWDDPSAWGLMLVDLAMIVSLAYEQRGLTREHVLEKIKQTFEAEWVNPTDFAALVLPP